MRGGRGQRKENEGSKWRQSGDDDGRESSEDGGQMLRSVCLRDDLVIVDISQGNRGL